MWKENGQMKIEEIIKKEVLGQTAYAIDPRTCRIKLDANENPHPLPAGFKEKIRDRLDSLLLNRYPQAGSPDLKFSAAGSMGVTEDMILIGNGSDELIQTLLTAIRPDPAGGVMIPVPTFAMYKIGAINTSHTVIEIPLNDGFDLPIDTMLDIISKKSPAITLLSYPNNPSGNCFDAEKIKAIIAASEGIVVVDEAYFNFSRKTFLPYLEKWDNLVILRTLSKVGLAALRIGVMVAHPSLIHQLDKVRLPYNLNMVSQVAGQLFFDHEKEFLPQMDDIIAGREWLLDALKKIDGIVPYPSDANFILFSCHADKNSVYEDLIKREILIKNFPSSGPLKDCMRVTVGTTEENEAFIKALKEVMIP